MASAQKEDQQQSKAWRVCTFGELSITFHGTKLPPFSNRKVAQLLLFLATRPDRAVARDLLAETLWPGEYIEIARDRLRQTLSLLNKHFRETGGIEPLESTRTTVSLVTADCEIDREEFLLNIKRASSDHHSIVTAAALIGQPFGEGHSEDWVRAIREQSTATFLTGARPVITLLLEQGDFEKVLAICDAALAVSNLDESLHLARVIALRQLGRQVEAHAAKLAFEAKLLEANGLRPSARWTEETKVQVTESQLPNESKTFWISMSQPVDRFFGRERELELMTSDLYQSPAPRMLTITGQGGAGKTRLSIEFARRLSETDFPVKVMVGLAEFDSVSQMTHAIAEAFEVAIRADDELGPQLSPQFDERKVLFVLDNCEHLLPQLTPIVHQLLTQCPTLTVVCTSRLKLGIHGEREIALAPLQVPSDDGSEDESSFESVQLLINRIQSRDFSYQPAGDEIKELAQLSRLLEGVPLALELAASQTSVLSVQELLDQLTGQVVDLSSAEGNLPARHLSLRQTLAWSFERLSPALQSVLSRLSVFSGPWTIEMAANVLGEKSLVQEHLDLRDAGLIRTEPNSSPKRFRMLEMVRQFVGASLDATEKSELLSNHFLVMNQRVFDRHGALLTSSQRQRVADFRADLPNVRLAIQTGLRSSEHRSRLPVFLLSSSLTAEPLGLLNEWAGYADELCAHPDISDSKRGILLAFQCHVHALTGVRITSKESISNVFELFRLEAQPIRKCYMINQAIHLVATGGFKEFAEEGLALLEQAIAICQDEVQFVNHLLSKAQLLELNGDDTSALEVLSEAQEEASRLNSIREMIWININRACICLKLEDSSRALDYLRLLSNSFDEMDDPLAIVWLARICVIAVMSSDPPERNRADVARLAGFEAAKRSQFSVTLNAFDRQAIHECRQKLDLDSANSAFAIEGSRLSTLAAGNLIKSLIHEN